MKNILISLFIILLVSFNNANSQVVDGITYQAVALDESGKEIAGHDINGSIIHSKAIGVRFSILKGGQDGEVLYCEVHSTNTDPFGLFSLVIGQGSVSLDSKYRKINEIDWGSDKLFLKVELDIRNKGDFKLMGIEQMMAVPFAFHALTSSSSLVRYEDILNKPALSTVASSGSFSDLINKPNLFSGSYSDLTGQPNLFDGNYNSLTNKPTLPVKVTDLQNDAGYLTSFAESDPQWNSVSANYYTKSNLQTIGESQVNFANLTNKPTTSAGYGITDVLSSASPAGGITNTNITNWNTSYNWGNHAGLYKPITYVPGWSEITSNPFVFSSLANGQLLKYNSSTGKWENWAPDYLTSFTESDPAFSVWNKSTGISITASQVSDFQASVTNNAAVLANTAKNSYPVADATKLAGIQTGAEVNVNADWNASTGDAKILNKPTLSNVAVSGSYTDLLNLPVIPTQYTDAMADLRIIAGITGKVDKETGKGLSTNDYTTAERTKLAGIASGAEVNVTADWSATTGDAMILNKPTTLAGYGITDALTTSSAASGITSTMVSNWNTAFGWGDHSGLYKSDSYVPDWTEITNKPIFSPVAESGDFSDLSNKPTTLSGYGITDAISTSTVQSGTLIYAPATGSSNNYSVTLASAPLGYTAGMFINFKANFDNTGSATLNVNGLGAKTIKKIVTTDLDAGDIKNGQVVSVIYDGSNFQLLNPPSTLVFNNPNTISHGVQNLTAAGVNIFTVPAGVHQIYIKQYAAGGGKGQNIQLVSCSDKFASGAQGGAGGYINITVNCIPGQKFEISNGTFGVGYTSTLSIPDYGCGSTANSIGAASGASAGNSYIKDLLSLNILAITNGGGGGGGATAYLPYMSSYTYSVSTPSAGSSGIFTLNSGNGAFLISGTVGGGYSGNQNGTTTIEW